MDYLKLPYCITCNRSEVDLLTIAEIEDPMITSYLSREFYQILYPSDCICSECLGYTKRDAERRQECMINQSALSPERQDQAEDQVSTMTEPSGDYSPMSHLPDLCLREIFLLLPIADKFSVERVCTRWNAIGRKCWSSITEVSGRWPPGAWEIIIPRTTKSLRHLSLILPTEDSYISRKRANEAVRVLESIGLNFARLEEFETSLKDMFYPYTVESLCHLLRIISNKTELKHLRLWCLPHIVGDDEDMAVIAIFCDAIPSGVEEICLHAEEEEGSQLNPYALIDGVLRFKNLHTLALFNFDIGDRQLEGIETLENLRVLKLGILKDSGVGKLFHLTKLECLELPNANMWELSLSRILRNNMAIKRLDISGIDSITSSCFEQVRKLPHLEVLDMQGLNNLVEEDLIALPATLQTLDCIECTWLTSQGIQRLFVPHSSISELNLSSIEFSVDCFKTAIKWVSQTGKSLKILVDYDMLEVWEEWKEQECNKEYLTLPNVEANFDVIEYYPPDVPS